MYKHYLLEKISEIETVFEDKDDKKLIDEKEIKAKEKEKKILKEKILWLDSLEYDTLYRKLTKVEEEILKKYYGLIGEKRESIFEIENDLKLERGSGEKSFIEALSKLSSAGGKIIRV